MAQIKCTRNSLMWQELLRLSEINPIHLKRQPPKSSCVFQEVVTWRLWVWINGVLPWQQCHRAEGQSWPGQSWANIEPGLTAAPHTETPSQPSTHKVRVYITYRGLKSFLSLNLNIFNFSLWLNTHSFKKKVFPVIKMCIDLNTNPLNEIQFIKK